MHDRGLNLGFPYFTTHNVCKSSHKLLDIKSALKIYMYITNLSKKNYFGTLENAHRWRKTMLPHLFL